MDLDELHHTQALRCSETIDLFDEEFMMTLDPFVRATSELAELMMSRGRTLQETTALMIALTIETIFG